MKSFILFATLALFSTIKSFSQAEPIEGTVDYQKGEKRAAIVEIPFSPDIVEGALKTNLAKSGVKEERLKGMQVFKGARLTPTDGEVADLYFKVDKKSRREDNISVVYLIVGRPNENVALRTPDDAYRIQDAKSFLTSLPSQAQSYDLESNITKRDEDIKKSERKIKDLDDDQKGLERKIKDLQDRVEQRRRDKEAATNEINRLKAEKDALILKRVGTN